MNVRSGFIESIGNTPLIKLKAASAATGCEIYGKAEFLNPGGSVKDRAALAIIEDAEKRGKLKPGGVFGLPSEGEDILVKVLPFAEAYAMVERNEIDNAVGVIALQWLALHREEVRKRWR